MTKLLIIEDEQIIQEELVEALSFEGFDAIGIADGETGLEMVHQVQPDLIVCDVLLPGMDGFEVLQALKSQVETRQIPFIFLTCLNDPREIERGYQLGANGYIVKPFK